MLWRSDDGLRLETTAFQSFDVDLVIFINSSKLTLSPDGNLESKPGSQILSFKASVMTANCNCSKSSPTYIPRLNSMGQFAVASGSITRDLKVTVRNRNGSKSYLSTKKKKVKESNIWFQ